MKRIIIIISVLILCAVSVYAISPKSYYSSNHPMLDEVRQNFSKIKPEYAKIPLREGDSAYTENKAVITLCLKDPHTGQFYDMNVIMYVALHELAHMISKSQGHGSEFRTNFANLLRDGAKLGIYDPRKPIPLDYCGTKTTG